MDQAYKEEFPEESEPELRDSFGEEPLFDSYEERYLDIEGMLQERYEHEQ